MPTAFQRSKRAAGMEAATHLAPGSRRAPHSQPCRHIQLPAARQHGTTLPASPTFLLYLANEYSPMSAGVTRPCGRQARGPTSAARRQQAWRSPGQRVRAVQMAACGVLQPAWHGRRQLMHRVHRAPASSQPLRTARSAAARLQTLLLLTTRHAPAICTNCTRVRLPQSCWTRLPQTAL